LNISLQSLEARHPAALPGTTAALRALNLQFAAGELVAIIGPSGAGKTTLLQVLACAQPPSGGKLQLAGLNPWTLPARALRRLRGQLFLAPQVPPLPPRQRVVTSVLAGRLPSMSLWASLRSLFYPVDIPAAYNALVHFDLGDKLFDRVDRLSGGERQRVLLARALSVKAAVLLMDEPLVNLDPPHQADWLQIVRKLVAEGTTVVSVLHEISMALHADTVVVMANGRICHQGPSAAPQSHRALEQVFDKRIAIHAVSGQWVSLACTP
jgi:phosphonate transport system ATP-binding protein